mmetsp:Transcript_65802/g.174459  ORF Transcript_65802/g.174459 Transcript_65802/m.174459 type:complete len:363 (-) Transcript_65802:99-1187(-)
MMMREELQEKVTDLQRRNEALGMENEMLADYLQRSLDGWNGSEDVDDVSEAPTPGERSSRKGQQRGRQGAQRQARLPTSLTLEEKYQTATQEVEALGKDIEQTRKTSEQNLDIVKALMEETDIRIAEVKRDAYEFRRDIVVGAENPRTGKTMAEKVLKYMEDKLTQKDMLINKLLNKNKAYKSAIRKADSQLKSKAQTGDDLQYIDFHQLQIENQQFVIRIDDATAELLELKRRSGKTVMVLNVMKKALNKLNGEVKFLQDEIRDRKAMLKKTESDIVKIAEEKESARKDNKRMRAQANISTEMPKVRDYVDQKAELQGLEVQHRSWERKVDLAEVAARRLRAQLRNSAGATHLPMGGVFHK